MKPCYSLTASQKRRLVCLLLASTNTELRRVAQLWCCWPVFDVTGGSPWNAQLARSLSCSPSPTARFVLAHDAGQGPWSGTHPGCCSEQQTTCCRALIMCKFTHSSKTVFTHLNTPHHTHHTTHTHTRAYNIQ